MNCEVAVQPRQASTPPAMFGAFRLTNPLSGGLLWYIALYLAPTLHTTRALLNPQYQNHIELQCTAY